MKTSKFLLLFVSTISVILIISCNKEETSPDGTNLSNLEGNYSGEFTTGASVNGIAGTANVIKTDDNQLLIHCYGDSVDTTFVMDVFDNGDSVMVCDTVEDLNAPYGMMGSGNHMMDRGSDESEWMLHMQYDPNAAKEHYGSFDMTHHSFQYSFNRMEGDSIYTMNFYGTKQK